MKSLQVHVLSINGGSIVDKNMNICQSNISTSWMIVVVLLTTVLAICIFLYDMTKYIPMLKQPKPKVRSGGMVVQDIYTCIVTHVTFL